MSYSRLHGLPKEMRVMRGKGNVLRMLGYQRVVYVNVALEGE